MKRIPNSFHYFFQERKRNSLFFHHHYYFVIVRFVCLLSFIIFVSFWNTESFFFFLFWIQKWMLYIFVSFQNSVTIKSNKKVSQCLFVLFDFLIRTVLLFPLLLLVLVRYFVTNNCKFQCCFLSFVCLFVHESFVFVFFFVWFDLSFLEKNLLCFVFLFVYMKHIFRKIQQIVKRKGCKNNKNKVKNKTIEQWSLFKKCQVIFLFFYKTPTHTQTNSKTRCLLCFVQVMMILLFVSIICHLKKKNKNKSIFGISILLCSNNNNNNDYHPRIVIFIVFCCCDGVLVLF